MGFRVDGSKTLLADVRVALGGGHIRMAKKILYHTEVRPTIKQVRREAVTQGVWMCRTLAAAIENAANIAG